MANSNAPIGTRLRPGRPEAGAGGPENFHDQPGSLVATLVRKGSPTPESPRPIRYLRMKQMDDVREAERQIVGGFLQDSFRFGVVRLNA